MKLKTIMHTEDTTTRSGHPEQDEWWHDFQTKSTMTDGLEDSESGSSRHDIEEHDVFSACLDARQRTNELRVARGFCFLVALGPEAMPRSQPPARGAKGARGKGRRTTRHGDRGMEKKVKTAGDQDLLLHPAWIARRVSDADCTLLCTKRPRVGQDQLRRSNGGN